MQTTEGLAATESPRLKLNKKRILKHVAKCYPGIFFSPFPDGFDSRHIFTHLNSERNTHTHTHTYTQAITPKPVVLKLTGKRLWPRCFHSRNKSVFSTLLLTFNMTKITSAIFL